MPQILFTIQFMNHFTKVTVSKSQEQAGSLFCDPFSVQAALIASARNSNFIRYFTNTLKGREKEHRIKIKIFGERARYVP